MHNDKCIMHYARAQVYSLGKEREGWTGLQGSITESSCCSLLEAGCGMWSHGTGPSLPCGALSGNTKVCRVCCRKWVLIFGWNEKRPVSWWCDGCRLQCPEEMQQQQKLTRAVQSCSSWGFVAFSFRFLRNAICTLGVCMEVCMWLGVPVVHVWCSCFTNL